jgi:hypothetical protein
MPAELPGLTSRQPKRNPPSKVDPRDHRSAGVVTVGSAGQPVAVANRRMTAPMVAVAVAVAKRPMTAPMVAVAATRHPAEVVAAAAVPVTRAVADVAALPAFADGGVSSPDRPSNAVRWRPLGRHTSPADRVVS